MSLALAIPAPASASAASATTAAAATVLKCPECDFVCLSNNQMCRHIYLTCHTLVPCQHCATKLVCWGFAPGVKKLFEKGRRDNVLLETVALDTAEKHFEATQHQNNHVPTKDAFVVPGPPEAHGLQPQLPKPDPAADPTAARFRCPDCANVISTWTQMTRHLDATKHSLARCAECALPLKCYGPAQPQRHEKMTGHRGLVGIFRQKADYMVAAGGRASPWAASHTHTRQYRCYCGVSFLHPLHIAEHLINVHRSESFKDCACQECGVEGDVATMLQHMDTHEAHNEFDIPGLDEEEYLVRLPRGTQPCIIMPSSDTAAAPTSPFHTDRDATVSFSTPQPVSSSTPSASGAPSASSASSSHRILYQCPDCWYLFSSWVRIEDHLTKSKHGLAFCRDCGKHLRPRIRGDHTSTTGHRNLVGVHLSRRDYEVLVNIEDPGLKAQIDAPPAFDANVASESRMVYQCPLPSCRAVFTSYAKFEDHMIGSRHGSVTCDVCFVECNVVDAAALREHEHPLTIPAHLASIQCAEDCSVVTSNAELIELFPDVFARCTQCHHAVPCALMSRHEGSAVCVAAAAKLDKIGWETTASPPSSNPGSFNANVAPIAVTAPPMPLPLPASAQHLQMAAASNVAHSQSSPASVHALNQRFVVTPPQPHVYQQQQLHHHHHHQMSTHSAATTVFTASNGGPPGGAGGFVMHHPAASAAPPTTSSHHLHPHAHQHQQQPPSSTPQPQPIFAAPHFSGGQPYVVLQQNPNGSGAGMGAGGFGMWSPPSM